MLIRKVSQIAFKKIVWGLRCLCSKTADCEPDMGSMTWQTSTVVAQGAYWTLDKRRDDLPKMATEWRKTLSTFSSTFPETFQRKSVKVRQIAAYIPACSCHSWQYLLVGPLPSRAYHQYTSLHVIQQKSSRICRRVTIYVFAGACQQAGRCC